MNWIKQNASFFELKNVQRVRFWIKIFPTCQISKKNCFRKIMLWLILLCENDKIRFFCSFLKSMILKWRKSNASDFELKKKHRASDFELKKKHRASDFELKKKLNNALHFELRNFWYVSFWNKTAFEKSRLACFTPWKQHFLFLWIFFKQQQFELRENNASDFELHKNTTLKIFNWKKQRVRIWNEIFPTGQVLS